MDCYEFSREFDILYNNITSNQAPALNSYEKSVFLTEAQEGLVLELYRGGNGGSFERTEEFTSYLTKLTSTAKLYGQESEVPITSKFFCYDFLLPQGLWFIVYESATVISGYHACDVVTSEVSVVPITHDTLDKTLKNPYKQPNRRRVLRLSREDNQRISELISALEIDSYLVRYLRKPKPIILEDLSVYDLGLSINGETKPIDEAAPCELSDSLQRAILSRAVQLAQVAWSRVGAQATN